MSTIGKVGQSLLGKLGSMQLDPSLTSVASQPVLSDALTQVQPNAQWGRKLLDIYDGNAQSECEKSTGDSAPKLKKCQLDAILPRNIAPFIYLQLPPPRPTRHSNWRPWQRRATRPPAAQH